ncbi:MAG: sugar O-acetyltransferase [Synergistaceae bacterium]|nr:sugar O-acetyltransferase [Synergistaceae bacterium]
MISEREKMIAGELYNPNDPELVSMRHKAHRLCTQYNQTFETDEETRCAILRELLPNFDEEEIYFQGPIYFDYGANTFIGKNFYANFNTTILDVCPVKIGDNVMLGTGVSLLTPVHPLKYSERNARQNPNGEIIVLEYAKPIVIGNNCWLASNVTVVGGVSVGDGSVIGAGSVVTRDIPANVFAAGNPCKIIKQIDN